ncbi:uncharacterized protein G2W53_001911 [Senna tora]|uniref:Uncharacterized protein n=1 Tax=Senna tora TaxID=362788 RepID=A0A835CIZ5_9FABA|nr:uncharacterized protein G2W53_001911 [Senna tora]
MTKSFTIDAVVGGQHHFWTAEDPISQRTPLVKDHSY